MFKGLCRLTGVVVLVCSTVSTALGADSGKQVYTGTLGNSPIVFEVNSDNGKGVSGRYFYQKYRKDLILSGEKDGEALKFEEGNDRDREGKPRPNIRLQPTPNGLSGEWTSPQGKVLKIELLRAKLPPVPAGTLPYLATLHDVAPYEYLRLQGMKLKQGKTENFMGYTLQWWREPQSGMSLFEVVSGYTAEELQRINHQLMGRLWQQVVSFHDCLTQPGTYVYSQTAVPLWMSPSVISVNIMAEDNCGGSYSDERDMPFNLDTKTGKTLVLEDVLWIGLGEPQHYELSQLDDKASYDAYRVYSEYRTKELAPWLVGQLRSLYPEEVTTTTDRNDGCVYGEEQSWIFPSWYFTDQGIKLLPSFAHNEAMCRSVEWSVLPYNLIKQHPGHVALKLP
ncbi:hypothetical protein BK660_07765 [Pseudomonas brassicacearum]|uniref:DUF3298 domain-containing protein n=1 Tax=Pseudomonas brassicacearum TaxID=930166 RepID=A0A423ICH6_9PSED|nr:hypothetical protein [Pseudomonas brassicacearum]RON23141.1 hypothetical protein BK660_07765 [Pseudomonas brassicacearum]